VLNVAGKIPNKITVLLCLDTILVVFVLPSGSAWSDWALTRF